MAPRVLIADDDAWILRMVSTVLEKRGYVVETATDGEDAYARALKNPPDLVITDVMMPRMDGWSLVRALRARPEMGLLPVPPAEVKPQRKISAAEAGLIIVPEGMEKREDELQDQHHGL